MEQTKKGASVAIELSIISKNLFRTLRNRIDYRTLELSISAGNFSFDWSYCCRKHNRFKTIRINTTHEHHRQRNY